MPTSEDLGVGRVTKRRNGVGAGGLPVADSRPVLHDGRIEGSRCTTCRYPSAQRGLPWCPVCYAPIADDTFAVTGTAWASAVVAIPVNDVRAPFALAYVDLDDGPRVLARLDVPAALPIDARVRIVRSEVGDLVAARADVPAEGNQS
jgi:uncharacterized OB-fold protein